MKKGFTLVELLGVIIILGVLALITFLALDKSIKKSQQNALDKTIENIERAAYNYSSENDLGYEVKFKTLTLTDLAAKGYLEENIINPVTNDPLKGCVLYRWDVENNQYIFEYNEKCEVPTFPGSLIETLLKQYTEGNQVGLVKDETNPNLYYYTGNKDEVTNNFLWYGGHQWRVLEFDTSAKTLILITQQPLTTIAINKNDWTTEEEYNNSYVNNWLNEYFWDSLESDIQNNIQDNVFDIGIYNVVTSQNINNLIKEIKTTKKVGLLSQLQYLRSGYFLGIRNYFGLGNVSDENEFYQVGYENSISRNSKYDVGIRPVIKILDIDVTSGDGSLTNSYRYFKNTKSAESVQVGEYINVPYSGNDNACGNDKLCTFRVVKKESDKIKVVLNGLLPLESESTDNPNTTISTSDGIYLKSLNPFISNIDKNYLTTGTFGIGSYTEGDNYLIAQSPKLSASIGLPTIGEMFSSNDIDMYAVGYVDTNTIENLKASDSYWTMNKKTNLTYTYYINDENRSGSSRYTTSAGIRPVIYLKSSLKFIGGNGTAQNPYVLQ